MCEVWRTTFWLMRNLPCGLIHIYTMGQNADVLQVNFYLLTIKAGYRIFNNTRTHLNYKNLVSQLTLQCPTSRKNWPMKLCSCYESSYGNNWRATFWLMCTLPEVLPVVWIHIADCSLTSTQQRRIMLTHCIAYFNSTLPKTSHIKD